MPGCAGSSTVDDDHLEGFAGLDRQRHRVDDAFVYGDDLVGVEFGKVQAGPVRDVQEPASLVTVPAQFNLAPRLRGNLLAGAGVGDVRDRQEDTPIAATQRQGESAVAGCLPAEVAGERDGHVLLRPVRQPGTGNLTGGDVGQCGGGVVRQPVEDALLGVGVHPQNLRLQCGSSPCHRFLLDR